MPAGKWEPVIEPSGALGHRAASLLDSITSELLEQSTLDAALFLAYRAEAEQKPRWMKRAVEHLNKAIGDADTLYSTRTFRLLGGLSGLGWVIEHLTRQLSLSGRASSDTEALNNDTDAALLLELQRGRWKGSYGLASGLTGIGAYFLKRLPAPNARLGLDLVFGHLQAAAGPATIFDGKPGVAEGQAGALYFLSAAGEAGAGSPETCRLLANCEQALLDGGACRENSCFWWNGILAVAAVRVRWARVSTADAIPEWCLQSAPEGEASLLHGAAGAAHLWSRIHGRAGDPRYRAAALRWWDYALSSAETTTPAGWTAGAGFLDGSAGFGLALSAALAPVEPEWDAVLGLSIPNAR